MNIIQGYASTYNSSENGGEQFRGRQQFMSEKHSGKHLTILMEDLDAKVGMDKTGYECTKG